MCVHVVQAQPGWTKLIIKVADFGLSKHDATITFTRVVSTVMHWA
jgi:hypothetical protein